MRQPAITPRSDLFRRGFTIVELLIVIVVIGILAAITIVAYNGIRTKAEDASMQSEASQAGKKVLAYKALNSDALPADAATGGLTVGSGRSLYYRVTPDGKNFCISVNITGSPERAYSFTSTNQVSAKGTCQGYILVPGNATFGTSDFWVMKYEAKNVSGIAISQAATTPWATISQTDAISTSTAACTGCHLISEAEWMTIAANVLGVNSNWSGGTVGSGYIYSGHNDSSPNNALAADTNDANGYSGTGNSSGETAFTNSMQGNSQRRTLALSNGEVAWDLSGNVWDWTTGTIAGGQQPGLSGDPLTTWKQWTNGSIIFNGLPASSRPSAISGTVGTYSSSQNIGQLASNYNDATLRGFLRGGTWSDPVTGGALALFLGFAPGSTGGNVGFRVAR
jgi:prepilin-type N-terminal cleavage/methylation domain-containing protein